MHTACFCCSASGVCDWCGEFNTPLYAHVCAWSSVFIVYGLGWTDNLDTKFSDELGVLQHKTVFYLSSDITCGIILGCYYFCSPYYWEKLHKTCCGTLHKTLKWLVTCIQNKRKLPNFTLCHKLLKKFWCPHFRRTKCWTRLHKICMICCYNGLNEICVGLSPLCHEGIASNHLFHH